MNRIRQQAGLFPLGLPLLLITIIPFLLIQDINGQPNYYFKASAPAVKSLPRIGRRSDDGGSDTSFTSNGGGGQNLLSLSRSLEAFPPGILEMWNNPLDSLGGNVGPLNRSPYNFMSSSSGAGQPSLIPPNQASSPSSSSAVAQLEKSVLWRKLLGDINNYDDAALLENLYHSKS
ncbi:unnamed protein product [Orchesella dallaii]|uniref:Uncharacterized protein n=1 Tax=Orchesella dallaii TaxID=48710 RepID=A0ABP1QHB9_9HEXA